MLPTGPSLSEADIERLCGIVRTASKTAQGRAVGGADLRRRVPRRLDSCGDAARRCCSPAARSNRRGRGPARYDVRNHPGPVRDLRRAQPLDSRESSGLILDERCSSPPLRQLLPLGSGAGCAPCRRLCLGRRVGRPDDGARRHLLPGAHGAGNRRDGVLLTRLRQIGARKGARWSRAPTRAGRLTGKRSPRLPVPPFPAGTRAGRRRTPPAAGCRRRSPRSAPSAAACGCSPARTAAAT